MSTIVIYVAIILLICVFTIVALIMGGTLIYVYIKSNQRTLVRERLLIEVRDIASNNPWFPVRYASQARFKSPLKIFPWEGAGVVVIQPEMLHFIVETSKGERINLQMIPGASSFRWLGRGQWFRNGAICWFETAPASAGVRHYFTSETGPFIFGSEKSTQEIFQKLGSTGARLETAPPPPRLSTIGKIALIIGLAFICAGIPAAAFYHFATSDLNELQTGLQHVKQKEWQEAIEPLEHARSSGVLTDQLNSDTDMYLADAYMHVGRYQDAVDAAYRAQKRAETNGHKDNPLPYLTLGKALSFRYAETRDVKLKQDSQTQLVLFVAKATAQKMTSTQMALLVGGSKHRLETGELITDEDLIKKLYP